MAITRTEHLSSFMRSFADIVKLPLPQRAFTDVEALLRNLTLFLGPELDKRTIIVQWDLQARIEPVLMDPHQMEQVFLNILKNAMEAIAVNGKITIRLGTVSRREFVTIEDTGSGITEETRRNLFTPFFSTKEHGQGIGLTLVQEILVRHKYEFSLESMPNQPTRFTIFFS